MPCPTLKRGRTLTGQDALGDWTTDAPGVRRKITTDDLATPYATPSAENHPRIVARPEGAWPQVPAARGDYRLKLYRRWDNLNHPNDPVKIGETDVSVE